MSAPPKTPEQAAQEKFSLRKEWREMRRNRADWDQPINEYGVAYYEVLVSQFRTLWPDREKALETAGLAQPAVPPTAQPAPAPPADKAACCQVSPCEMRRAAATVIADLVSRPLDRIKWSDLFVLEAMLAKLQPKEALSIELTLIREEYRELIGVEAYAALKLPLVTLPVSDADYAKALAEYEVLLQELHWNYLSAPSREQERTRLLIAITKSLALLVLVSLALRLVPDDAFPDLHVFGALAICGGLGAWFSAFRRAQSAQVRAAVLLNLRRYKWSRLSFAFAPWIGAVSAVILAFAFAGDVVSGKFFPVVRWTNELDAGTTNAMRSLGASATNKFPATTNLVLLPAQNQSTNRAPQQWHGTGAEQWWFGSDAEYALLLLWAFVAGFSERLVPDLLNRVAKKTDGAA